MRIEYDRSIDAAYLYIKSRVAKGGYYTNNCTKR